MRKHLSKSPGAGRKAVKPLKRGASGSAPVAPSSGMVYSDFSEYCSIGRDKKGFFLPSTTYGNIDS